MMPPDALHGCAPWFGQWCSFAISSLRRTRATYGFRAGLDPVELVAVRLQLVDRLAGKFGRGQHGDVVLLPRLEDGLHPSAPFSVPQDVMVEYQRPHIGGPEDSNEVGARPLRVDLGIVFGHVRHR